MSVSVLKQLMQEIKDAADAAGRHMNISMPAAMRKQKNHVGEMRRIFKQQDMTAAAKANRDAVAKGLDRPYDLTDPKSFKGLANKNFRKDAGDSIVETALEGTKYLFKGEGGDLKSRAKEIAKYGLDGVKDSETRLKIARTYMLAMQSEYGKQLDKEATKAVADGLYESYVDGTPADESVSKKEFEDYVKEGRGMVKGAHDLGKTAHDGLKSNY